MSNGGRCAMMARIRRTPRSIMPAHRHLSVIAASAALLLLAACTGASAPAPAAAAAPATAAKTPAPMLQATGGKPAHSPVPRTAPRILVHKTPTCGCCKVWIEHLIADGFAVEVRDVDDLGPIKTEVGVPPGKGSCHTAEVEGYFVEGHVPAEDIRRLLAERPQARGITVPGMPLGSPGMEVPGGRIEPYTVELVRKDGSTSAWAQHGR
jgi:hypothetical protein